MHYRDFPANKKILLLCALLLTVGFVNAARAEKIAIPQDLQQWVPWVLHEQQEKTCTLLTASGGKKYCTWPSRLNIDVQTDGARFSQQWRIETRSLVPLPGNSPFWPEHVQVDGKNILLSKQNLSPAVWLEPGSHTVTGKFRWNEIPENILIPPETGLVDLTVLNKKIANLQLDSAGKLWLQHKTSKIPADQASLNVQVFRQVQDGVPLTEQLHILLTVSGKPRQITLGLTTGRLFVPLEVQSPLPVRLDKSGRLRLQVRPGQWQLRLTLRNTTAKPPEQLTMGTIDGVWPDEEIWVFAADPKLRQIDITGVRSVDPSRTSLPKEWTTLPAYLIKTGESMTLVEKNRGNPHPSLNRLTLHRTIWLDEQGTGFTASDAITGTMTKGWRLNVASSQSLGKVEAQGVPSLITRLKDSEESGVEVRQGRLDLQAESRIDVPVSLGKVTIPALGWSHTFQQLSAELQLPPGWKLFTATGIDKVSTWLNRWTLLDLFLVMMIALATARILGLGWGMVAFITLVLSYHQPGVPKLLWLPLLVLLGIQKMITARSGERFCRIGGLIVLIALVVTSVPYMINEIRIGLYPQLEHGKYYRITQDFDQLPVSRSAQNDILAEKAVMDESVVASSGIKTKRYGGSVRSMPQPYTQKNKTLQVDPQDMIQTGPGLPEWKWKTIQLHWNGPVTPDQQLSLYLLSPRVNTILAFVRVLLLTLLLGGFLRRCLGSTGIKINTLARATKICLFCLVCLGTGGITPASLRAEMPSAELLQELQNRLLAPPKCGSHCAIINSCNISADKEVLRLELNLDAQKQSAVALPGANRFFDTIYLDGQPAPVLRLDEKGNSIIRIAPGSHTVQLTKQLNGHNDLSFSFPLLPEKGQSRLKNWTLNGLRKNGLLEKQITLHRITKTPKTSQKNETESDSVHIEPFVQLERTLHLGLKWSVTTNVIRRSPETVIALDIPLLHGEQVTTESLQVHDRHIRINMGPEQNILRYTSSMTPVDQFTLHAEQTSSWTEKWFLDVSPIWHVDFSGIPEINQTNPAGKRFPEFHPYPGESLQLDISRPKGVEGPVMTINRSHLSVRPGLHATENTLSFALTASRGLQHTITLPADIDLQKTLIDKKEVPLQFEKGKLIIPVRPGKQQIEIGWRSRHGIDKNFVPQPVNLGITSVNTSIEMLVPSSRWILLTGGPRIGPAVLFWGELLVLLLLAFILGRIRFTPLSTLQWLLLSLGLSQIPVPLAAVVVGWLLLLGLRKQQNLAGAKPALFNMVQIFLVLLTLAALGCLFFAIQQGLLGHPDMQIGGNGSAHHTLRWYQDRTEALLPSVQVISVPLLAYRISMLLWALWLAMALLRWLRWGWDCFSEGGLWKKKPANRKKGKKKKTNAGDPLEIV